MKKIYKRILGWFLLFQILPVSLMFSPEMSKFSYIEIYLTGQIINLGLSFIVGTLLLVAYLIFSEQ